MAERTLERRIVSVLFCDVVGFTSLSETLDAEDVVAVQDAYFAAVRETVSRYGGILEKFIGDAAVAVFGVPRVRDDDAVRAVRAGLALAAAVDGLGARLGLAAGELRLRVGVNTGEVVYAEATAERGPVTGDTVNVAARLQTAAPPGGVLVGEQTALAAEGAIVLDDAGALALKGKAESTNAWLAVAERDAPSRELAMRGIGAPVLGRDAELAQLRERVERLDADGAGCVVIVAPPGVGKTRLVDELAEGLPDIPVLKARLRPDVLTPFDGVAQLLAAGFAVAGLSLGPRIQVSAALEGFLRAAGVEGSRAVVVADVATAVLRPTDVAEAAGDARDREAVFAAWREALAALAGGGPSVWIVEDGHWASGDLLAFLAGAGASSGQHRLVLVTARPVILERLPLHDAAVIELKPLSQTDTASLIAALVGAALPDMLVERVVAASDGNPLFVEELLRSWVGSGLLERSPDGWRLNADVEVTVPSTVQTIYAAQLDDLPQLARTAARRAAVAGRRFPEASLEGLGIDDAAQALDVLARRALIGGPDADAVFGSTWAYRHALLRDAGYASLTRAERATLHVSLARWLEAAAGDGAGQFGEVIGRHWVAAVENTPRLAAEVAPDVSRDAAAAAAAAWFERGAEAALDVSAHETARALLERALASTAADATVDVARRRRRLGEAIAPSANMDEATGELEQARELARTLIHSDVADTRVAARAEYVAATVSLGWVYNQQVRFEAAERLAAEALGELGERDDEHTAHLLVLRAQAVLNGTDATAEPLEEVRRALALARRVGARRVELDALELLADEDESDPRSEGLRRVHALAVESRAWPLAVGSLTSLALRILGSDRAAAGAALDDADDLARAHGLLEERAWIDYARAEIALLAGEWDAAVARGLCAAELAEEHGYRRAAIRSWYAILPVAAARGDAALIRRGHVFSARVRPDFPSVPAPWARLMSTAVDARFERFGLPRTAVYAIDDDAMLPTFDHAALLPSWLEATELVAQTWLDDGALDRIDESLRRLAASLARTPHPSPVVDAVRRLVLARLELWRGATARASSEAGAAAAVFEQEHAPAWRARALRIAEAAGAATDAEVEEAAEIEQRLGVVRT